MRLIVTDEWGLIKHFHSTKREGERRVFLVPAVSKRPRV